MSIWLDWTLTHSDIGDNDQIWYIYLISEAE